MAQEPVIIKGTRRGLEIVLDRGYAFEELKIGLARKLESANGFFDGAKFSFRRESVEALTEDDKSELLDICRRFGLIPFMEEQETAPTGSPAVDQGAAVYEKGAVETGPVTEGVPPPAGSPERPVSPLAASEEKPVSPPAASRKTTDGASADITPPLTPFAKAGRPINTAPPAAAADRNAYVTQTAPYAPPAARVMPTAKAASSTAAASDAIPGEDAVLVRRSLRSGQRITAKGHIVVMGDVNYGAEVIASGSIFVLGHCRGIVHAGSEGDPGARVLAWKLEPTVLSIAGRRRGANISRTKPEGCQVARLMGNDFVFQSYMK